MQKAYVYELSKGFKGKGERKISHEILVKANEMRNELVGYRRYLHQNPEIGFELPNTVAYVEKILTDMGMKPKK